MTAPLVSVILPTRNRADVVMRSIDSVLAQTYRNLEVIVVNDASTDDTRAVLYAVTDYRVGCLHLESKCGKGGARNVGLLAARGEFIAFNDDDDLWLATKLENQLALFATRPDLGWVGGCWWNHQDGRRHRVSVPAEPKEYHLLFPGLWFPQTWLVRRGVMFGGDLFDATLPMLEDWEFLLRLSERCRLGAVQDEVFERFVRHDSDSFVTNRAQTERASVMVMSKHGRRIQGIAATMTPSMAAEFATLGAVAFSGGAH